jgi:hypothetical protein
MGTECIRFTKSLNILLLKLGFIFVWKQIVVFGNGHTRTIPLLFGLWLKLRECCWDGDIHTLYVLMTGERCTRYDRQITGDCTSFYLRDYYFCFSVCMIFADKIVWITTWNVLCLYWYMTNYINLIINNM